MKSTKISKLAITQKAKETKNASEDYHAIVSEDYIQYGKPAFFISNEEYLVLYVGKVSAEGQTRLDYLAEALGVPKVQIYDSKKQTADTSAE